MFFSSCCDASESSKFSAIESYSCDAGNDNINWQWLILNLNCRYCTVDLADFVRYSGYGCDLIHWHLTNSKQTDCNLDSFYFMLCYFILCYLISSYFVLSHLIWSNRILSYLILSYLDCTRPSILSYLILSYLILSYLHCITSTILEVKVTSTCFSKFHNESYQANSSLLLRYVQMLSHPIPANV